MLGQMVQCLSCGMIWTKRTWTRSDETYELSVASKRKHLFIRSVTHLEEETVFCLSFICGHFFILLSFDEFKLSLWWEDKYFLGIVLEILKFWRCCSVFITGKRGSYHHLPPHSETYSTVHALIQFVNVRILGKIKHPSAVKESNKK